MYSFDFDNSFDIYTSLFFENISMMIIIWRIILPVNICMQSYCVFLASWHRYLSMYFFPFTFSSFVHYLFICWYHVCTSLLLKKKCKVNMQSALRSIYCLCYFLYFQFVVAVSFRSVSGYSIDWLDFCVIVVNFATNKFYF